MAGKFVHSVALTEFAKRLLTAQGIDYGMVKRFTVDVSVDDVATITVVCMLTRDAADILDAQ